MTAKKAAPAKKATSTTAKKAPAKQPAAKKATPQSEAKTATKKADEKQPPSEVAATPSTENTKVEQVDNSMEPSASMLAAARQAEIEGEAQPGQTAARFFVDAEKPPTDDRTIPANQVLESDKPADWKLHDPEKADKPVAADKVIHEHHDNVDPNAGTITSEGVVGGTDHTPSRSVPLPEDVGPRSTEVAPEYLPETEPDPLRPKNPRPLDTRDPEATDGQVGGTNADFVLDPVGEMLGTAEHDRRENAGQV